MLRVKPRRTQVSWTPQSGFLLAYANDTTYSWVDPTTIGWITDHSLLSNLDYASSWHTWFQAAFGTPWNTGSMMYYDGTSRTDTAPMLNHWFIYSGSDIRMQASATSYASLSDGWVSISDISAGSGSYSVDNLDLFANGIWEAKLWNDYDNNILIQLRSFNTYGAAWAVFANDDNASYIFSAITGTTFGTDTGQSFLGILMNNVWVRQLNDWDVMPCNGFLIWTSWVAPIVMGTWGNEQFRIDNIGPKLTGLPAYADDTAAWTAWLTTGYMYQTDWTGILAVAGIVMIKQ